MTRVQTSMEIGNLHRSKPMKYSSKNQMDGIYREKSPDKIPWNMATLPELLRDLVESGRVPPCKALDLGCGAGHYAIALAELGFRMTGIDFSETAIDMARENARKRGVECRFITADVLDDLKEVDDTFDFTYDWELLHHIFPEDRETYVHNVSRLLNPGGRYLSVCFSEESDQFGGKGKIRETLLGTVLYFSSEGELKTLFEPSFSIEELTTVDIQGKRGMHRAVMAFMTRA